METILYSAATEALVSEATHENVFKKMCEAAFAHVSVDTFVVEVKETEKAIKRDFSVKSMPGPWRSAKSVVQNAMALFIPLKDDNGEFRGKTWLQNAIKDKKTVTSTTTESYTKSIISKILNAPEGVDKAQLILNIQAWVNK